MRTRREFLIAGGAGLCVLAAPLAAQQPPGKIARIGRLSPLSAAADRSQTDAFWQGLRALGWVEGRNVSMEYRFAGGDVRRLPELAAELVRLKVDVILAGSVPAARAAKTATATIPVVMAVTGDPVASGLVASLARPGANLTGVTALGEALSGKRLEVLKEALPGATRVAVLSNPAFPDTGPSLKAVGEAARALRVQLRVLEARNPAELDKAFAAMKSERMQALLVLTDVMFATNRKRIVELAAHGRLPVMYSLREFMDDGGLMFYGSSNADMYRHASTYVDKILKGAKPSDLPIEQATRIELVVNMKTAKTLGVGIPQSVLARADEVIE
jgi:putative ABC transport system substrate-binding protein